MRGCQEFGGLSRSLYSVHRPLREVRQHAERTSSWASWQLVSESFFKLRHLPHVTPHQRTPAAVATGDKVRNHYFAPGLGNFAWCWLVTLALVGRFMGKRKIFGARPLQDFPFSPPAEERGQ